MKLATNIQMSMPDRMTVLIIGYGYAGLAIATQVHGSGAHVMATSRNPETLKDIEKAGYQPVDMSEGPDMLAKITPQATHIISTAPPDQHGDPVISHLPVIDGQWLGYLSTTGVYGDRKGGWAFEWDTPTPGQARSKLRLAAEKAWAEQGAVLFRCGGIYGPGRSAIDRLTSGKAKLIHKPGHVFSRIHVDDLASAVIAAMKHPEAQGPVNLVDDVPCDQSLVYEEAARLTGLSVPDPVSLDDPSVSDMLKSFYAENRRVSNARAKAALGWRPVYPSYREGLEFCYSSSSVL